MRKTQAKGTCGEHELAGVISKSYFHAKGTERRILRGYCRGIGPKSSLSTSILGLAPKLRTRAIWGEKNTLKGTHISEWPSRSGSWGHNKVHWGQRSPRISKAEVRTSGLPSEMTFRKVLQDTDKHCQYKVWREVLKYLRENLQSPHSRLCN